MKKLKSRIWRNLKSGKIYEVMEVKGDNLTIKQHGLQKLEPIKKHKFLSEFDYVD